MDAVRGQYADSTEQLRAQFSSEAESSRNTRFEETERIRSEKNEEIAVRLHMGLCCGILHGMLTHTPVLSVEASVGK